MRLKQVLIKTLCLVTLGIVFVCLAAILNLSDPKTGQASSLPIRIKLSNEPGQMHLK